MLNVVTVVCAVIAMGDRYATVYVVLWLSVSVSSFVIPVTDVLYVQCVSQLTSPLTPC